MKICPPLSVTGSAKANEARPGERGLKYGVSLLRLRSGAGGNDPAAQTLGNARPTVEEPRFPRRVSRAIYCGRQPPGRIPL